MAKKLIIFLTIFFWLSQPCFAESWFGKDKIIHFSLSLTFGALARHLINKNTNCTKDESRALTLFTVSGIGAIKEWADEKFSYKDLGADIAGVSVSLLF